MPRFNKRGYTTREEIEEETEAGAYSWELFNGGMLFWTVTFMDIPALNMIPRVLLNVISRLESDGLQSTWSFSRNQEGFSFSAKQVKVLAKREPRDPDNNSGVDVETKPNKHRKTSPSKLAHERARRKRYRKKAALKAASRQREQTSRDSGKPLLRGWNLWHLKNRNLPVIVLIMN